MKFLELQSVSGLYPYEWLPFLKYTLSNKSNLKQECALQPNEVMNLIINAKRQIKD